MKFICGLLFSVAIIYVGILCIINPEYYDFVGMLVKTVCTYGETLPWYIDLLLFLIVAAVATVAVFTSLSSCDSLDLSIISYIVCCIAGLGIAGVEAVNYFFDQNIVIPSTVSMWSNLVPLITMLMATIYAIFRDNYEWWHIIAIAFGGISAILVGMVVCTLIMVVIFGIAYVFIFILFIAVLIAFFAALGK